MKVKMKIDNFPKMDNVRCFCFQVEITWRGIGAIMSWIVFPQNFTLKSSLLAPQNVTVFGDEYFKEDIKENDATGQRGLIQADCYPSKKRKLKEGKGERDKLEDWD